MQNIVSERSRELRLQPGSLDSESSAPSPPHSTPGGHGVSILILTRLSSVGIFCGPDFE